MTKLQLFKLARDRGGSSCCPARCGESRTPGFLGAPAQQCAGATRRAMQPDASEEDAWLRLLPPALSTSIDVGVAGDTDSSEAVARVEAAFAVSPASTGGPLPER